MSSKLETPSWSNVKGTKKNEKNPRATKVLHPSPLAGYMMPNPWGRQASIVKPDVVRCGGEVCIMMMFGGNGMWGGIVKMWKAVAANHKSREMGHV
jgi:hypothetical protein